MLFSPKKRKIRIPTIKIEARSPRLMFTNRKEKRKKEEMPVKVKRKITG